MNESSRRNFICSFVLNLICAVDTGLKTLIFNFYVSPLLGETTFYTQITSTHTWLVGDVFFVNPGHSNRLNSTDNYYMRIDRIPIRLLPLEIAMKGCVYDMCWLSQTLCHVVVVFTSFFFSNLFLPPLCTL